MVGLLSLAAAMLPGKRLSRQQVSQMHNAPCVGAAGLLGPGAAEVAAATTTCAAGGAGGPASTNICAADSAEWAAATATLVAGDVEGPAGWQMLNNLILPPHLVISDNAYS